MFHNGLPLHGYGYEYHMPERLINGEKAEKGDGDQNRCFLRNQF